MGQAASSRRIMNSLGQTLSDPLPISRPKHRDDFIQSIGLGFLLARLDACLKLVNRVGLTTGLIKTEKPLTLAWRAGFGSMWVTRKENVGHHDDVIHSRSQPAVRKDVSSWLAVLNALGFDDRPHHSVI